MTSSRSWRKGQRLGAASLEQSLRVIDAEPVPKLPKKRAAVAPTGLREKAATPSGRLVDATTPRNASSSRGLGTTESRTAGAVTAGRRRSDRQASASARDRISGTARSSISRGQIVQVVAHAEKVRQALVLDVSAGQCTVAWCKKGQLRQLRVSVSRLRGVLADAAPGKTAANPAPGEKRDLLIGGRARPATISGYKKNGRVSVHFRDAGTPGTAEMTLKDLRSAVGISVLPTADPLAAGPNAKISSKSTAAARTKKPRQPTVTFRPGPSLAPVRRRPVPTGPVRSAKPADVFPVGSVVEFESGGVVRRGEVRRTIGTSEVVVAFSGPGGTVSRPILRHRLSLVA
jgi:hypothetical protein